MERRFNSEKESLVKKLLMWVMSVAIGGGTLATVPAVAEVGVSNTAIRIGTFGPITGANFVFGKYTMNGLEVVFDGVNAAGGIHGRKLELIRVDDHCDPAGSIAAVRRLLFTEKVFAIVGGACSNGVMAAKPDIINSGAPFVNFAAASDTISAPKVRNIFTSMLTSALESKLQAQYLVDKGIKKVAVVNQPDAWGRDRHDSLTAALKAANIQILADEELSLDANDATAQVLKIQSSGAGMVVLLSYPKPAAIFLRDAARLGFKPSFLGTSVIPDPVAFYDQVAIPGATDKFLTISPIKYQLTSAEAAPWKAKLLAKFPLDKPHAYNLYGITAGQLVVKALQDAGQNLTRDGFIKALDAIRDLQTTFSPAPLNCQTHQCLRSAAWVQRSPQGTTDVVGISSLK
ncbi:ABC transporter substrate-binding protein [Candidimonas nitroreducens]|uniref:Leucine-binding protein domain-containing protein n=1 Tax=Candidimonas nitroreducens TaxID=683354 RepID=A0A225MVU0_9BURK|nr:ABC transporter substrate-binding protein [Candidimonas nitroreducens]OWT63940.1 hypothetical protein CEY11_06460 [Candidimonas nitroreducens]